MSTRSCALGEEGRELAPATARVTGRGRTNVNTRGDERLMCGAVGARDDNPRRPIDIIVDAVSAMWGEKACKFAES